MVSTAHHAEATSIEVVFVLTDIQDAWTHNVFNIELDAISKIISIFATGNIKY